MKCSSLYWFLLIQRNIFFSFSRNILCSFVKTNSLNFTIEVFWIKDACNPRWFLKTSSRWTYLLMLIPVSLTYKIFRERPCSRCSFAMMVYFQLMMVKCSLMMVKSSLMIVKCSLMMVKCKSMMVKWVFDHTLISSLNSISPSLAWSKPSFTHLTIIEKLHRLPCQLKKFL